RRGAPSYRLAPSRPDRHSSPQQRESSWSLAWLRGPLVNLRRQSHRPRVARVRLQGWQCGPGFPQHSDTQPGRFSLQWNQALAALDETPPTEARDWRDRHFRTHILSAALSLAAALKQKGKAQRAWCKE